MFVNDDYSWHTCEVVIKHMVWILELACLSKLSCNSTYIYILYISIIWIYKRCDRYSIVESSMSQQDILDKIPTRMGRDLEVFHESLGKVFTTPKWFLKTSDPLSCTAAWSEWATEKCKGMMLNLIRNCCSVRVESFIIGRLTDWLAGFLMN